MKASSLKPSSSKASRGNEIHPHHRHRLHRHPASTNVDSRQSRGGGASGGFLSSPSHHPLQNHQAITVKIVTKRRAEIWDRLSLPRVDHSAIPHRGQRFLVEDDRTQNEVPGGDLPDKRLTPYVRVQRKLYLIKQDPDAQYKLRERIERYKKDYLEKKLRMAGGRNLLHHHVKLCNGDYFSPESTEMRAEARRAKNAQHLEMVRFLPFLSISLFTQPFPGFPIVSTSFGNVAHFLSL